MNKLQNETLAFAHNKDYKGFNIKAYYGDGKDARIEIIKDGEIYKEFLYPAYKIFNLSAHFRDIVDGELEKSDAQIVISNNYGNEHENGEIIRDKLDWLENIRKCSDSFVNPEAKNQLIRCAKVLRLEFEKLSMFIEHYESRFPDRKYADELQELLPEKRYRGWYLYAAATDYIKELKEGRKNDKLKGN